MHKRCTKTSKESPTCIYFHVVQKVCWPTVWASPSHGCLFSNMTHCYPPTGQHWLTHLVSTRSQLFTLSHIFFRGPVVSCNTCSWYAIFFEIEKRSTNAILFLWRGPSLSLASKGSCLIYLKNRIRRIKLPSLLKQTDTFHFTESLPTGLWYIFFSVFLVTSLF